MHSFSIRQLATLLAVLVLALAGISFLQAPHLFVKENVDTATSSIITAFNSNDFGTTLDALDARISSNSGDIDALLMKAATLAHRGSLEFKEAELGKQAIDVAESVLALPEASVRQKAEAHRTIGYAHEIMQEYRDAHTAYTASLQLDPMNALTIAQEAHSYDLEGKKEEAEAGYRKALSIDVGLELANMGLARIMVSKGDYKAALPFFLGTASTTDNARVKAEALYSAGILSSATGRHDNAEALFTEATLVDPTYPLAFVGLASQQFARAIATSSGSSLSSNEATLKASFGNLDHALKLYPLQTSGLYQLGLELAAIGKVDAALQILKDAKIAANHDNTLSADDRSNISTKIQELTNRITSSPRPQPAKSSVVDPRTQAASSYLCFFDGCISSYNSAVAGDVLMLGIGGSYNFYSSARLWMQAVAQGANIGASYDSSGIVIQAGCYNGHWSLSYAPNAEAYCVAGKGSTCASRGNRCGMTNVGTVKCDGSCDAPAPSDQLCCVAAQGSTCRSGPNRCGKVNSGTISCNGVCSAAPPADAVCPVISVLDCNVGKVSIPNGASGFFYSASTVGTGDLCSNHATERRCVRGVLSGSTKFSSESCIENDTASTATSDLPATGSIVCPSIIRSGEAALIKWNGGPRSFDSTRNVRNRCKVTGGPDDWDFQASPGTLSTPLSAPRTYTLSCTSGSVVTKQTCDILVVPVWEEN